MSASIFQNRRFKVLVVHNYLRPPSGENVVFDNEKMLLQNHGNYVISYERDNSEIAAFRPTEIIPLLWQSIWSQQSYREIHSLLQEHRPDVAHFHNTFPLISLASYRACFEQKIPIIQTLHNYRMICPGGLLFRNNQICDVCVKSSLLKGALHGCYNDSHVKTTSIVLQTYVHRVLGTFKRVTYFLALNEFCKQLFVKAGLPEEKILVKPNFIFDFVTPSYVHRGYALYLGRVSPEKDIRTLIQAWRHLTHRVPLKIAGAGNQLENMKALATNLHLDEIEFLGYQPKEACEELVRYSRFLVIPSKCYETFSLVVREAFAVGKPVVASRLGALAEAVSSGVTGLTFTPGNPTDFAAKIDWMVEHEEDIVRMGRNARREYERKYTPEKNYQMLMAVYEKAVSSKRGKA